MAAYGLTERERDVTRLILQATSTVKIAQDLVVSTHTVQQHLKSILKTGVRSRRKPSRRSSSATTNHASATTNTAHRLEARPRRPPKRLTALSVQRQSVTSVSGTLVDGRECASGQLDRLRA